MRSLARGLGIVVALGACGRIGFSPGALDAAADSARDASGLDATLCTGPFGAAAVVASTVSPSNEWGGALSPGGLELYFGSDRAGIGTFDIYRAERPSRSDEFGPPVLVPALETSDIEDNPFVTADGLELWFDRSGEIMRATRSDLSSPWQVAQPVASLNSSANDVAVMLRGDLLTVYFASDRSPGAGNLDLYMAQRQTPTGTFGAAIPLSVANSASFECCPYVTDGGSQLLFTTAALGSGIAVAAVALDSNGLPTGSIAPADFDDVGEEVDVFETADGTLRGYSYRPTQGTGDFDLYIMERDCP